MSAMFVGATSANPVQRVCARVPHSSRTTASERPEEAARRFTIQWLRGGGFFEHRGERFYFERECELGDVVIYSGETIHGVGDVDVHKPFRHDTVDGRLCAFVTLYRHFTRKGQLDDYIDEPTEPTAGRG